MSMHADETHAGETHAGETHEPTLNLAEVFSHYENLELVLESMPEAIIVHDLDRRITFFNRAAERLTGQGRDQVLGTDCHNVLESGFCGSRCAFCTGCEPTFEHLAYPVVITRPDGTRRQIEMTIVPMKDAAGALQGVLAVARDITEVTELRRAMEREHSFRGIVGQHQLMRAVFDLVREVAHTEVPVLIQGKSGTGKELVASAIHNESSRAAHPFVAINCGAIPEGLIESELFGHVRGAFTGAVKNKKGRFEIAHGGTIFLDEVGELSQAMQVKLLRVLESMSFEQVGGEQTLKVNVRIISATNRDLSAEVAQGRFRQDLFYRLAVVPITLPPLCKRRTDVLTLADHFLERFCAESDRKPPAIHESAAQLLIDYRWPGNVRELMNALQYALVKTRGAVIDATHLPPEITRGHLPTRRRVGRKPKLTSAEVRQALRESGGNRAKAARRLGVGRSTLYRYLARG